jgi:hypothetical protein
VDVASAARRQSLIGMDALDGDARSRHLCLLSASARCLYRRPPRASSRTRARCSARRGAAAGVLRLRAPVHELPADRVAALAFTVGEGAVVV